MFQITFPLADDVTNSVYAIAPDGWRVEKTRVENIFSVKADADIAWTGKVSILPGNKKAIIDVCETTENGEAFWRAFGKKYRDLDPYTQFWGIVYPAIKEGKYELVCLSEAETLTEEDLDVISKYGQRKAYLIRFYRGRWINKQSVYASSLEEILGKGCLGPKLTGWEFSLQ